MMLTKSHASTNMYMNLILSSWQHRELRQFHLYRAVLKKVVKKKPKKKKTFKYTRQPQKIWWVVFRSPILDFGISGQKEKMSL